MPSVKNARVIVIGGGFGGIAAALRCRALGFKVTLIERLEKLGGRAQVIEINGFKHDAGPTVITAPFLFEELFALFGEDINDHVSFIPLSPWYRYIFHNGQTFDYSGNQKSMISEIKKFSHDDIENYNKLVQSSKKIFDIGFTKLAHKPFLNIRSMIEQLPNLIKLRADKTVSSFVNKHIKHPLLRKAFSIHPLLVGGNPFSTTSIYSLIHYLEKKWGIHFCKGGTGSLVEALTELMRRQNIEIITRTDVQKLICKDNRIKSVMLDNGKILNFDHVICNVDPPIVYQQLLQEDKKYSFRTSKFFSSHLTKYSMGLYVLFFGTKKQYPEVVHHTIWLTSRFKELLKDIIPSDE